MSLNRNEHFEIYCKNQEILLQKAFILIENLLLTEDKIQIDDIPSELRIGNKNFYYNALRIVRDGNDKNGYLNLLKLIFSDWEIATKSEKDTVEEVLRRALNSCQYIEETNNPVPKPYYSTECRNTQ